MDTLLATPLASYVNKLMVIFYMVVDTSLFGAKYFVNKVCEIRGVLFKKVRETQRGKVVLVDAQNRMQS